MRSPSSGAGNRPGRPSCLSSYAREVVDPVGLPSLAAVVRERLLPARARRGHPRPGEADADRLAPEDVVALEDAGVARERSDHGRVEQPRPAAVGPVDRPLARDRVEEAKRHPDEAAVVVGAVGVLVAEAAEDRPGLALGLELVPVVGAREPLA